MISKSSYHTKNIFSKNLIAIGKKISQIFINKAVYLGLSKLEISEISKIAMYEFWYDYIKPKHNEKAKLYYMHTE